MKQAIIELKKKLLLVESDSVVAHMWRCIYDTHNFIGKLTDIKESQFAEWVPESNKLFGNKRFNYKKGANVANTAKESFFSKLESLGIYFENPIQKPGATDHSGMKDLNEKLDRYYEAEKKVWDLSRTYLYEIL